MANKTTPAAWQPFSFPHLMVALDKADGKEDCVIHKAAAAAYLEKARGRLADNRDIHGTERPVQEKGLTPMDEVEIVIYMRNHYSEEATPTRETIPNCKPSAPRAKNAR